MGLVDFNLSDVGNLFKDIREAITGKAIDDPNKKLELLSKISELEKTTFQMQAKIVEAEAKSEHWLTSTWRPITMLTFVTIIANNYIIVPYAQAFGLHVPTLELTDQMWDLLKIGIGGYVVGRSAEKIAKELKGKSS